mmetsp:Transcript_8343/g.17004  ORF Transcript_8343/g.17004 Transcript_8343/m.17004 type:complete len:107 (-) Transcript_8343:3072-3392(-)
MWSCINRVSSAIPALATHEPCVCSTSGPSPIALRVILRPSSFGSNQSSSRPSVGQLVPHSSVHFNNSEGANMIGQDHGPIGTSDEAIHPCYIESHLLLGLVRGAPV